MDKRRRGHTYGRILCAISIQTYTARTVLPDLDTTGSHATLDRSMKGAKFVEASREPPPPGHLLHSRSPDIWHKGRKA